VREETTQKGGKERVQFKPRAHSGKKREQGNVKDEGRDLPNIRKFGEKEGGSRFECF